MCGLYYFNILNLVQAATPRRRPPATPRSRRRRNPPLRLPILQAPPTALPRPPRRLHLQLVRRPHPLVPRRPPPRKRIPAAGRIPPGRRPPARRRPLTPDRPHTTPPANRPAVTAACRPATSRRGEQRALICRRRRR